MTKQNTKWPNKEKLTTSSKNSLMSYSGQWSQWDGGLAE